MRVLLPLAVLLVVAALVLFLLGVREVNAGLLWAAVITAVAAAVLAATALLRRSAIHQ